MKTQIKTLGFSLLFGASLFAQQGKHLSPEDRATKHVDRLEKQLELSADQKEKIKIEAISLHKQLQEFKPSKEDRVAHKLERKKHHEELKAKIAPVLTDDQKQKLAEMEAQRKEKREAKKGDKKGKAHKKHHHEKKQLTATERAEKKMQKINKAVGLSEDQKQKITAIHLESIKKQQEKKEAFKADRKANKEEKLKLINAYQAKVKGMLTPDQAKKYDQIIEKKQARRKSKRENK